MFTYFIILFLCLENTYNNEETDHINSIETNNKYNNNNNNNNNNFEYAKNIEKGNNCNEEDDMVYPFFAKNSFGLDENEYNSHENAYNNYFSRNINEKYKIVYGKEFPHNINGNN